MGDIVSGVSSDHLREPWFRLQPKHALVFERQAEAEIAPGHVLHGIALNAVAKCDGCDDVVFRVFDGMFAMVHLTWTLQPERPPRPQTTRRGSFMALETAMDQHAH